MSPTRSMHTSRPESYLSDHRRTSGPNDRFEPLARQQTLQRAGLLDTWSALEASQNPTPASSSMGEQSFSSYSPFTQHRQSRSEWADPSGARFTDSITLSEWQRDRSFTQPRESTLGMSYGGHSAARGYRPGLRPSVIRRTSSEDASLSHLAQYYGSTMSSSLPELSPRAHAQRRPSNRDEFDGPAQLLDKPEDSGYEPREEELPRLPVTLHAQEQDDILSQVNDRLSQCAFDFVAKYQFPIPVEPDKRPVRVPNDREWSEWVYLLKRLATKRRIPARILYNGQIKQLITILENSLEMRHAAKHQSRPLKDDRNVLQLISSGLQVAKILKDAPAMQFLDGLYVQTERMIQARRAVPPSAFGTMCLM